MNIVIKRIVADDLGSINWKFEEKQHGSDEGSVPFYCISGRFDKFMPNTNA